MLDFTKLRGGPGGWRTSFDALVRQLGRLDRPTGGGTFHHIHGDGGDGGIEAFWLLGNGDEIGFQAKYHSKSGEIDWRGLTGSVSAALQTHPRLVKMIVAIACDLTGPVAGRRGRNGIQQWHAHVEKWQSAASALGRSVEFEFWGASEIEQRLTVPAAAGLYEYWFSEKLLTPRWIAQEFERTVAMLDERFHPEDHVDVRVRRVFDGLRRTPDWAGTLSRLLAALGEPDLSCPSDATSARPAFRRLKALVDASQARSADFELPPEAEFPYREWAGEAELIATAIRAAEDSLRKYHRENNAQKQKDRPDRIRYALHQLAKLDRHLEDLVEGMAATSLEADRRRFVFVTGRAGSGKSHLLATEVQTAIEAGEPALMLLGTDFASTEPPDVQICRRLGLSANGLPNLLGMLEAAAETAGCRALIVLDAVNEGGGATYWRSHLLDFARNLKSYRHLVLCIACRTEYADYLLTNSLREEAALVEVPGFVTPAEQESAARIYMDRRGIIRPSTPWLSPEFTNPLFLRTACTALERAKQTQFPRGLRGTREMLRFYLESAARGLDTQYDGSTELFPALRDAVLGIAKLMADNRTDFVTRAQAASIVSTAFAAFVAPPGFGWLDRLRQRGILRADPSPPTHDDPLADHDNVYRFGFQRFQDHLIAQSLLSPAEGPGGLFRRQGALTFLVTPYGIDFEWQGVFQALAIQFADLWQAEIVDHLPGGASRWWHDYAIQDSFAESVRWRLSTSFSERTVELLDALESQTKMEDLLLELALVNGHPCNGDFLHRLLSPLTMAKRDSRWTLYVNEGDDEDVSPVKRLIDWAARPGARNADPSTRLLALQTLAWLFTSTNGAVRDRATKAASELLLADPEICVPFLARFEAVNDPYVIERVLAAVAGACMRNPTRAQLIAASAAVWKCVFEPRRIPCHLLARDYAWSVMELAFSRGFAPSDAEIDLCRPPYGAPAPRLNLDDAKVKARCEAVGDHSIFSSCSGFLGDFGRKTIEPRVRDFTALSLRQTRPLTHDAAYSQFRTEFVEGDELRELMLDYLEHLYHFKDSSPVDPTLAGIRSAAVAAQPIEEKHFLSMLSAKGRARFATHALPHLKGQKGWCGIKGKVPRIDPQQARLWVAQRAIALGWTTKLFPRERSWGDDRARSTRVERIGKKYQWIAYYELLARLADNFWLRDEYGDGFKQFETTCDISFTRDIDPTIPIVVDVTAEPILSVPPLGIDLIAPGARKQWTYDEAAIQQRLRLATCPDIAEDDGEWLALYRDASARIDHPEQRRQNRMHMPFSQEDFHYLMLIAVPAGERAAFVKKAASAKVDFHEWLRHDLVDGPYLYEGGKRATWPDESWVTSSEWRGPVFKYLAFTHGYQWETHLDGSLPDGLSIQGANPWLLEALGATADPYHLGIYRDGDGMPVVIAADRPRNSYALIRRTALLNLLEPLGLVPRWVGIGERTSAIPEQEQFQAYRRWNGAAWLTDQGMSARIWKEDKDGSG
jgi:hypothetical protein